MQKSKLFSICITIPLLLSTNTAFAQERSSPVTFNGSLIALTVYHLRGVSVTGNEPAVQGALAATKWIGAWKLPSSYKFFNLGLSYIDMNKPGALLKGAF